MINYNLDSFLDVLVHDTHSTSYSAILLGSYHRHKYRPTTTVHIHVSKDNVTATNVN